jgi:uncharacterized protein (DUF433 family)
MFEVRDDTMSGSLCIAGTRIPVRHLQKAFEIYGGGDIAVTAILNDYPSLTREQVDAAIKCDVRAFGQDP